jgi:transcriptional regulator with XRE-family HTH domain
MELTQAALAEKVGGVQHTTIYKYEKEIAVPDSITLGKIAKVLETSTDYLLGLTENRYPNEENLEANFLFYDKENLTEDDQEYLNMMVETMKKRRNKELK